MTRPAPSESCTRGRHPCVCEVHIHPCCCHSSCRPSRHPSRGPLQRVINFELAAQYLPRPRCARAQSRTLSRSASSFRALPATRVAPVLTPALPSAREDSRGKATRVAPVLTPALLSAQAVSVRAQRLGARHDAWKSLPVRRQTSDEVPAESSTSVRARGLLEAEVRAVREHPPKRALFESVTESPSTTAPAAPEGDPTPSPSTSSNGTHRLGTTDLAEHAAHKKEAMKHASASARSRLSLFSEVPPPPGSLERRKSLQDAGRMSSVISAMQSSSRSAHKDLSREESTRVTQWDDLFEGQELSTLMDALIVEDTPVIAGYDGGGGVCLSVFDAFASEQVHTSSVVGAAVHELRQLVGPSPHLR